MERKPAYPPFEKVGGAYIDHEIKKFVIITKDILLNQLQRDCPKIAVSFDELLRDDLEEVSKLMAAVFTIILPRIIGRDLSDKERSATCARLLNTATTTFIGCIHLARSGFRLQYAILSRSVVETVCTVLYLLVSPNALKDFHSGKLKSTKSISAAKGIIPIFGQLWGFLSNEFVHITTMHSKLEPLAGYKEEDEDLSFIKMSIKTLAWLLYAATELTFIEMIDRPRYWKIVNHRHEGNEVQFDPSDEERAWQAAFLGMEIS